MRGDFRRSSGSPHLVAPYLTFVEVLENSEDRSQRFSEDSPTGCHKAHGVHDSLVDAVKSQHKIAHEDSDWNETGTNHSETRLS